MREGAEMSVTLRLISFPVGYMSDLGREREQMCIQDGGVENQAKSGIG
jgi:hypothetical protein